MSEWAKGELKRWIERLQNTAFITMNGIGDGGAWVRQTAEELLKYCPHEGDRAEQLSYLQELQPDGGFLVLRDKLTTSRAVL